MMQPKPKMQKSGNMVSKMYDLKNIYTGSSKTNPGVLKAKADKAKSDSVVSSYKKKSDTQKAMLAKKKSPMVNKATISEGFVFKKPVTSKLKSDNTKVSKVAPKEIVMSKFLVKKKVNSVTGQEKVNIAKKLYKDNPSKVFADAVKRAETNLTKEGNSKKK